MLFLVRSWITCDKKKSLLRIVNSKEDCIMSDLIVNRLSALFIFSFYLTQGGHFYIQVRGQVLGRYSFY